MTRPRGRAFVVNEAGARVDILDVTDSAAPTLTGSIDTSPYGQNPTSVAASNGVVAITVEANKKTADGTLLLADANGVILSDVKVGALPVAVAFTADGLHLVVANQGEVNKEGTKDPEGSISIIDLRDGAAKVGKKDVRTADFSQFNDSTLDPRIFAIVPGATIAQALEPASVVIAPDGKTAQIGLPTNQREALVDIDVASGHRTAADGDR